MASGSVSGKKSIVGTITAKAHAIGKVTARNNITGTVGVRKGVKTYEVANNKGTTYIIE